MPAVAPPALSFRFAKIDRVILHPPYATSRPGRHPRPVLEKRSVFENRDVRIAASRVARRLLSPLSSEEMIRDRPNGGATLMPAVARHSHSVQIARPTCAIAYKPSMACSANQ